MIETCAPQASTGCTLLVVELTLWSSDGVPDVSSLTELVHRVVVRLAHPPGFPRRHQHTEKDIVQLPDHDAAQNRSQWPFQSMMRKLGLLHLQANQDESFKLGMS